MSYSSLWHKALRNDKARKETPTMPSRKRKRENSPSRTSKRRKVRLPDPKPRVDSSKRKWKYDAAPVGFSVSRPSKHDIKGDQSQHRPKKHRKKVHAPVFKEPDLKPAGLESFSAPEIDSRSSNLDAKWYQPESQSQPTWPHKEINAPLYQDPDLSKLPNGFGPLITSAENPNKKAKAENDDRQPAPPRKIPKHTYKKAPGDPETPYNSLWSNKENYIRVDIETYLKKCSSSSPHPRSSYAEYVWR